MSVCGSGSPASAAWQLYRDPEDGLAPAAAVAPSTTRAGSGQVDALGPPSVPRQRWTGLRGSGGAGRGWAGSRVGSRPGWGSRRPTVVCRSLSSLAPRRSPDARRPLAFETTSGAKRPGRGRGEQLQRLGGVGSIERGGWVGGGRGRAAELRRTPF